MLIYFSVRTADNTLKKFKLRNNEFVTLGRGDKAVVRINDDLLSSVHAKIFIKDDKIFINDLASKNGTIIQGVKIHNQRVYLEDIIQIGQSQVSIDIAKLTAEDKRKLLYKGRSQNQERSLTLELESVTEKRSKLKSTKGVGTSTRKQRNFVKKSKLFKDSFNHKTKDKEDPKKVRIAKAIDTLLPLIIWALVIYSSTILDSNLWDKTELSLDFLINDLQFYTFGGIALGFLGARFNNKAANGTIGERIMKL